MASPQALPKLMTDPAYREEILTRVNERIKEGKSIQSAMKTIPGEWVENWVKFNSTHHRTPDRYDIDGPLFIQWRLRCLTLRTPLGLINETFGEELGKFNSMTCRKDHLEFGIATLEGIKQELMRGSLATPPTPRSKV